MKTKYVLFVPPEYALMYMSWEYGAASVPAKYANLSTDHRGWLAMHEWTHMMPSNRKQWTRTALEGFAARMKQAIAYTEGQLGKPLTGGGGRITVTVQS